MTFFDFLMVGIGGFFGAVIRYVISNKDESFWRNSQGTLVVNLAGALLIGLVFGMEYP